MPKQVIKKKITSKKITNKIPPLRFGHPSADDIRIRGWAVAVHNDYRLNGIGHTFWLMTHQHNGTFLKGEGESDEEALDQIRSQISRAAGIAPRAIIKRHFNGIYF